MRSLLLALLFAVAAPASAQLSADLAFPNLTFSSPVGVEHDPVNTALLYVVEQGGVVRVFDNDPDVSTTSVFLNIDGRVTSGGETGLLGLAFHPDYADNGLFYVNYTAASPLRSRVSQFSRSTANPQQGDPDSEVVLLEITQPFSNHNGGGLAFGPDGYLYASFGDGGSGGDPQGNGQDDTSLLGAILRLDVDGGGTAPDCGGPDANYTVPPNAIADGPGGSCDEIYAWGLRNPWRFSFDRETGDGWIADVGQNQWEEVDRMEDGGNYGWNIKEGSVCYPPNGPQTCSSEGLIDPVWQYSHSLGCSITGGYVYRGSDVPELAGKYVYGDYCSGRIWALDDSGRTASNEQLGIGTFGNLTSFGEDAEGELYFVRQNGRIYRFFSETDTSNGGGVPEGSSRLRLDGPNPFRVQTAISFALDEEGTARVAVYDVLGREVDVLYDGPAAATERTVTLDAGTLAAGVYIVRLESGRTERMLKVLLLR